MINTSVSYTGDGLDDKKITGIGFKPDLVITKREIVKSDTAGYIRTSTMPNGMSMNMSPSNAVLETNKIKAFQSDGFTIGTHDSVNESTKVYHALCLKAHPTDSVAVGSYVGSSIPNQSIAGLGFQPDVVIVAGEDAQYVFHKSSGHPSNLSTGFVLGNGTSAITSLDSDGFTVAGDLNVVSIVHHWFAWKDRVGFVNTSSYTGDGLDDRTISGTGFSPDESLNQKAVIGEGLSMRWHPQTLGKATDLSIPFSQLGAEANHIQELVADGIEIGTNDDVNTDTKNYVSYQFKTNTLTGLTEAHTVLFTSTAVRLEWSSVTDATHYQVQVSLFSDFRTIFQTSVETVPGVEFTDSQTDDLKRYWRWRPSDDGGTTFMEPFSEVGSYWLDTGAADRINMDRNNMILSDPDDTTDLYTFGVFPMYISIDSNLFHAKERNRLGELLSELKAIKTSMQLIFQNQQYMDYTQRNEFIRFRNIVRTFYFAYYKDGHLERPMPNIWKAQFVDDPSLSMMAAGRQDLMQGTVIMEEV